MEERSNLGHLPSTRYSTEAWMEVGPQAFGVGPESAAGDVNLLKAKRIVLIKKGPVPFGERPLEESAKEKKSRTRDTSVSTKWFGPNPTGRNRRKDQVRENARDY